MTDPLDGVTWFRGSSIRVCRNGVELHVDPSGLVETGQADFILLTHPHYDNFSEEDVARVRTPETVVIAPASMKRQLEDADHFMRPGDMVSIEEVDVLAVPAYNTDARFHPRESAWLGYVFTMGSVTYYHAGDTDYLEEMADVRCDVAFLPCDGRYTMGVSDVLRAAEACGARILVPIRWGDGGEGAGADEVASLAEGFSGEVRVLARVG